jgi:hypothetical protein
MKHDQGALRREYARFHSSGEFQVLGMVEIGSHARGEAISTSDRDMRLIIRSAEPYVLLQERAWTKGPAVDVATLTWSDLNRTEGVSFGLTNLAYVERCLEGGRFPLNDHTALFQGRILADEAGAVRRFCDWHAGTAYANIAGDYVRQMAWRVEHRLRAEVEFALLGQGLDAGKLAIPALHTCCRIVRDVAHIDAYRRSGRYVRDSGALERYYRARWPWFTPTMRALFDYKTNERQRTVLFEGLLRRDPACTLELLQIQSQTVLLWQQFSSSV